MNMAQLSGEFQLREQTFNVTNTVQRILTFNPLRWAVIFQVGVGLNANVSTLSKLTTTSGFFVNGNVAPIFFNFRDHGTLPCSEWWSLTPNPSATLTALEVIYRGEV